MAAGSNSWRIQVCGFGTPAFRNRLRKPSSRSRAKWLPRYPQVAEVSVTTRQEVFRRHPPHREIVGNDTCAPAVAATV